MPLMKPCTTPVNTVRHPYRLDALNRDALMLYAQLIVRARTRSLIN
jgi:hypothetical protein